MYCGEHCQFAKPTHQLANMSNTQQTIQSNDSIILIFLYIYNRLLLFISVLPHNIAHNDKRDYTRFSLFTHKHIIHIIYDPWIYRASRSCPATRRRTPKPALWCARAPGWMSGLMITRRWRSVPCTRDDSPQWPSELYESIYIFYICGYTTKQVQAMLCS